MEITYARLIPPPEAYRYRPHIPVVGQDPIGMATGVTYTEKGMEVGRQGTSHKSKGIPYDMALAGVNRAKSELLLLGKTANIVTLFQWRKTLDAYAIEAWRGLENHILVSELMCPAARELEALILSFGYHVGLQEYKKMSEIAGAIAQYDDSYRFLTQEVIAQIGIQKDIKDIYAALNDMESRFVWEHDKEKAHRFVRLVRIGLHIPSVRSAFKKAIGAVNMAKFAPDEDDIYWMSKKLFYQWRNHPA